MSEYQYYEFAAVDCPLSPQQQAQLRGHSSRARITAGGFINEYHWGNLKGDPLDWMRRYFDAHVYSAGFGSCRLMLRIPAASMDRAVLDPYVQAPGGGASSGYAPAFHASFVAEYCLLDWSFDEEGGGRERFWSHTDGPGWMARLLPVRDELLRGDLRPLYLGWLARVCVNELADDDIEPPVPPGLKTLTPAQQSLTGFLELDPDWLSAAASASPHDTPSTDSEHDTWLAEQSVQSLADRVHLLLEGRGQEAERSTRLAFFTWQAMRKPKTSGMPRRSVAEIAAGVELARERRFEAERQARAVAETERQNKRAAYLSCLAATPQDTWQEIDAMLRRGSGAAYDQALQRTKELAEAMQRVGGEQEFRRGLVYLLGMHGKRPSWIARLENAGLLWHPKTDR